MNMSTLETGTDHLLGRIEGHVAVLSFNRPEARNALSDEMYAGFGKALPQIAANSDIRVLMLTGEGVAFCSGGDVKGMHANNSGGGQKASLEDGIARLRYIQAAVSGAMRKLPQPVVAAIPGAAAGAHACAADGAQQGRQPDRVGQPRAFSGLSAAGVAPCSARPHLAGLADGGCGPLQEVQRPVRTSRGGRGAA